MGNIKKNTIQDIISGTTLHNIKQTIAQGQWHDFCRTCRVNEQSTGVSARTQRITEVTPAVVDLINADINTFQLQHLTVNWTNLCNLTCTYCNPTTSTAWQQRLNLPITHERNDSAGLIELAQASRSTLKGLTLGGGEPLLQKGLLEFLQAIDSSRVDVMITTNLSMDLARNAIYQELRHWPSVTWQVSFDNVDPDRFEYVRRGATWTEFEHNIQHMQQDQQRVVAHPAYSIYNALDLITYYEFCDRYDLDIYWCDLTDPASLDARRLPANLRLQAQATIDLVLQRYPNNSLSHETLQRYRRQLDSDWTPSTQVRTPLGPAEWHLAQEQSGPTTTTFAELWPEYTQ
jgi:molybdenum cofactor biosynthesis enzyme MoaA